MSMYVPKVLAQPLIMAGAHPHTICIGPSPLSGAFATTSAWVRNDASSAALCCAPIAANKQDANKQTTHSHPTRASVREAHSVLLLQRLQWFSPHVAAALRLMRARSMHAAGPLRWGRPRSTHAAINMRLHAQGMLCAAQPAPARGQADGGQARGQVARAQRHDSRCQPIGGGGGRRGSGADRRVLCGKGGRKGVWGLGCKGHATAATGGPAEWEHVAGARRCWCWSAHVRRAKKSS